MFEYIRLKNFKSFGDIEFNLLDKKGNPKKLILLYGENGIGKSNLASAFFMLSETLRTMDVRDIMQSILSEEPDSLSNEEFARKIFLENLIVQSLLQKIVEKLMLERLWKDSNLRCVAAHHLSRVAP